MTERPCWELTEAEYKALVWVRSGIWNNHTPKEECPSFLDVDWDRMWPLHGIEWLSKFNLTYTLQLTSLGLCALSLYEARALLARQEPVMAAAKRYEALWTKYLDDGSKPSDLIVAVRELEKGATDAD